jgi:hypothetical protein
MRLKSSQLFPPPCHGLALSGQSPPSEDSLAGHTLDWSGQLIASMPLFSG